MNRLVLASSALVALAAGSLASPASAAVPGNGIPALDTSVLTQQAQYIWGGRRYCFYPGGWHGPGWYRCGFAWRRGFGWGGGTGWNGWDGPRMRRGGDMRMEMRRDGDRGMRPGGFERGVERGGTDRGMNRGGMDRGNMGGMRDGNRSGAGPDGSGRAGGVGPGGGRDR